MESLRDRVIRHEGLRLLPYKDSLGLMTIGVGRCIEKRGISAKEAYFLLDNDLAQCSEQVLKHLPWTSDLSKQRQEVLVEMCFQLGINGLLAFKNTLTAVMNGKYGVAAQGMLDSKWAKQTPGRAKELADLLLA